VTLQSPNLADRHLGLQEILIGPAADLGRKPWPSPGLRAGRLAVAISAARQEEGEFQRLVGVEARVAMRVVAVGRSSSVIARAPPVHSVTSWPVISKWTPPGWVPSARWTSKKLAHLAQDAVEGPGLVAVELDRVAVHRIAGPDHLAPFALHRADQRGRLLADLVGAEAGDQRQAARLVLGVQRCRSAAAGRPVQRRAAFEADRVLDAAAEFDMGAVGLAGAVADPDHVAEQSYQSPVSRIDARQRLLVASSSASWLV
jgi:hypothetical protein